MFTSDEIKKAWMLLSLKGDVDHHGWDNINKVLDFLDNRFNKIYKCPEASKGCKPHGWPRGNPKWTKQQATSDDKQQAHK